ncbi:MAG: protease-like activity factor CPAF [Elusimicrobiota bacterium]
MTSLRRSLSAILALLIACPAPSLWAASVNAPVVIRANASGAGVILPVTSRQPLSGMPLSGGALSAPSLTAASLSPLLSAPVLAPAAGLSAAAALEAPAVSAEALSPREAAAVQITQMASEVGGLLQAAGDPSQASAESSSGLGNQVFQALNGESRGPALSLAAGANGSAAAPKTTLTQRKMLQTLYQVASVFSEQYAPMQWKKEQFHVDLKREYESARAAIVSDPNITTPRFQDLVYGLTASMRDYHVSVSFNSTERAVLPFSVIQAEGKYFLAYIDREKLPFKVFPFSKGDELVGFDGQRTADAVRALVRAKGENVPETDLRLAEIFLTNRRRARGDQVPQGKVPLLIRPANGKLYKVVMPWDYTPELVAQDAPVRDAMAGTPTPVPTPRGEKGGLKLVYSNEGKLKQMADRFLNGVAETSGAVQVGVRGLMKRLGAKLDLAIHPMMDVFSAMTAEAEANPFLLGARKSFVPRLGEVLWQSEKKDPFHAYIFKTKDGRKAGFIRIPSYMGGAKQAKRFGEIMAKFQKETDSLVIDQVNNPGGVVTYLYALASYLTDKPLVLPRHRMIITASEAQQSADLLLRVMQPQKKKEASEEEEGDKDEEKTASGYPITQKFMMDLIKQSQFIVNQFADGKRFTDLSWVEGIEAIEPAPDASKRYTKPILLLTNALDFSGGDFLPAILQDNKRVTQMGVRTAGAGGMVKAFDIPNQFGIEGLHATWSIAERPNGQPIENLGVTPDVPYELTAKDLRTGFAEYRYTIIKELEKMMGPAEAPTEPQP